MRIRSVVLFEGGFPAPVEEEGPDGLEEKLRPVADWLFDNLSGEGFTVGSPEWFDYEFQIKTTVDGRTYEVSVSLDFLSWRWFEIYFPRTLGLLARLVGKDETEQMSQLGSAIDRGLRVLDGVGEIRWYEGMPDDADQGFSAGPVETS
jgi:hypothetical protein